MAGLTTIRDAVCDDTLGDDAAVATTDVSTTFDSLTSANVVHLDTYSENGLSVTTSGDSWASDLNLSAKLDPFHGANAPDRAFCAIAWANEDWVTIQPVNGALMHGVEFMCQNDRTTGDLLGTYRWGNDKGFVDWQTLKDGAAVSDTIPGCEYRLVYAESLTTPTWNAVASPPTDGWKAGGGTLTFSDPGALGKTLRFYRAQVR